MNISSHPSPKPGKEKVHSSSEMRVVQIAAFPAPSVSIQVFPLFHALGADGLLIEYEDMFPYEGHLRLLRARHAYRYQCWQRMPSFGGKGRATNKEGMGILWVG